MEVALCDPNELATDASSRCSFAAEDRLLRSVRLHLIRYIPASRNPPAKAEWTGETEVQLGLAPPHVIAATDFDDDGAVVEEQAIQNSKVQARADILSLRDDCPGGGWWTSRR